jgi:hypothetical protein
MILIGGAGGKVQGDRHLAFKTKTVPTGNMLLSVLDIFGVQPAGGTFGDATGPLPGLV